MTETEDLFNELNKIEYLVKTKNYKKEKNAIADTADKINAREPCKTCKELNKGNRFHPPDKCWFKTKNYEKENRITRHQINNATIEAEYLEENSKNA